MILHVTARLRERLGPAAGNAGWLLFERLVRLGGGLLVGLWLARYLGPVAFGALNYAIALSLILGAMAALGLDNILVRELVRGPANAPALLGSVAVLRAAGGAVALGAGALAVLALRPGDPSALALFAVLGLAGPLQASTAIDLWFQARQRPRDAVLARVVAFVAASGLRAALILARAPLIAFAWAAVAEAAFGAAAAALAYRRSRARPAAWRFEAATARRLLADSWPLVFSGLMVTVYLRVDQLMLGQLRGDAELGVYSAAVRLAEVWPMLPTALAAAALPGVVAAREAGPAAYAERLRRLYAAVVALGYAGALGTTLLAGPIVSLLLGPEYGGAAPALVVLAWAGVFTSLGVARSTYLTAENMAGLHFVTVAAGCVANVGLNWLLIPPLGGLGAALASLVAYATAVYLSCFLVPRLRPAGRELTRALLWPRFW